MSRYFRLLLKLSRGLRDQGRQCLQEEAWRDVGWGTVTGPHLPRANAGRAEPFCALLGQAAHNPAEIRGGWEAEEPPGCSRGCQASVIQLGPRMVGPEGEEGGHPRPGPLQAEGCLDRARAYSESDGPFFAMGRFQAHTLPERIQPDCKGGGETDCICTSLHW